MATLNEKSSPASNNSASAADLAHAVLGELAISGALQIKRSKVRKLRRFLEGPDAWRDAPRGAGTRTFSLPNGDMLHFDYEATRRERDTAQSGEVLFDWVEAPRFVTVTLVPGAAA